MSDELSNTLFEVGIFSVVGVFFVLWLKNRGKNSRVVLTGPSAEQIETQRIAFTKMTVKQLRDYIQQKRMVLGIPAGRMPDRKAALVEYALELWRSQPW